MSAVHLRVLVTTGETHHYTLALNPDNHGDWYWSEDGRQLVIRANGPAAGRIEYPVQSVVKLDVVVPPRLLRDTAPDDDDRLYLDLKGARERLCRSQANPALSVLSRDRLQGAINFIDAVGDAACPQWSRFDRPESGGGVSP